MAALRLGAEGQSIWVLITVYGLLLIASTLLMADMARLHTYIRPLKLAYVDAGP
jgi:hypothetical protein